MTALPNSVVVVGTQWHVVVVVVSNVLVVVVSIMSNSTVTVDALLWSIMHVYKRAAVLLTFCRRS